ncbi:NADPH-dependent FMN reductase [Pigmentiphaga sp. GD03639]|jgi:FMN reductase|nr:MULTISPECIES: NADPH-dependent FMN reductase [unclassified Pigmentiphaga]MDH2237104.1 NADPH-dependent FMN reductase [Pigmentiphaga sp. GD03639]OVZ65840.1 FMN reductase (NADPH) [Pigmentiphaga sp. NML030171]
MHSILTITGSPSAVSRSTLLAQTLDAHLEQAGYATRSLNVRDLPAQALLSADTTDAHIAAALRSLAPVDAVIIATPIYKAAYSGILKTFLDLLPQTALQGKVVLPLATGGSPAHLLAVDYALRPVLNALGARHILSTVYAADAQITGDSVTGYQLSQDIAARLLGGLRELNASLGVRVPRIQPVEVRERLYA